MSKDKIWYRPGLLFKSKTSAHQEVCRTYSARRGEDGTVISETRELLAEFAIFGGEYQYLNQNEEFDVAADIRGHFFDLDAQAEQKEWTDEEKEIVARHMLRMAERRPGGDFSLYSKPKLPAPWPKYDATEPEAIAAFAEALGFVGEALLYEEENKNRPEVMTELRTLLNASQVEESLVAS